MRLIIKYQIGDDCTWWASEIIPIIYESAEKFIIDFEEKLKESIDDKKSNFELAGRVWDCSDFIEYESGSFNYPDIYTVDEWFDIS